MEFCDDCGSMMKSEDVDGVEMWVCPEGHKTARDDSADYVVTDDQEASDVIESTQEGSGLPTTEVHCPNCDNDRAHWYMQQIRAADESETRFFICTECEHKWREDDH